MLLHDGQYKTNEYQNYFGWGHSSMVDAIKFGIMAGVKKMLLFHHDPFNTDIQLKQLFDESINIVPKNMEVELAREGQTYTL